MIGHLSCQENDTIIGKVISMDNPCTTEPCLPGGVIALQTDSISYILTVNHLWNIDSFEFEGRYINIGDSIQVIGVIYEKVDLKDDVYYEIDIENVFFFDITAVINEKLYVIEIFPNPSEGIVKIKNTDEQISSICIVDLNGKKIIDVNNISSSFIEINTPLLEGVFLCRATLRNNQIVTTKIIVK